MTKQNVAKFLLGFGALVSCACSGVKGADLPQESQPEASLSSGKLVTVESKVLAQFNVGLVQLAFLNTIDPDGTARLSLRETVPDTVNTSPLQQLVIAQGLTALEAFLALAPAESAVPEELAAAHTAEAQALGRVDVTSVREVEFKVDALVAKTTAACDNWVFTTSGGTYQVFNKVRRDNVTGRNEAGTNWTHANVTVGACNESSQAMTAGRFWHIYDPTPEGAAFFEVNSSWGTDGPYSLAAHTNVRWYNWSVTTPETCSGLVCTSASMMYRVQGISTSPNLYHLRAGEVSRVIH